MKATFCECKSKILLELFLGSELIHFAERGESSPCQDRRVGVSQKLTFTLAVTPHVIQKEIMRLPLLLSC